VKINGFMSGFHYVSEWIMRLFVTNLLWIIFNLPIIYVAINLISVENLNEFLMIAVTMGILAPFVLFPSTTAMFAVIRKWVMKEMDFPIIRQFWRYYKENYLKSMQGGLFLGILWLVLFLDYYYFMIYASESFNSSLLFLLSFTFLLLFVFMFVFSLHLISYIVHIKAKLYVSIKDAMIITIGNPFMCISIVALNGLIIYVSFNVFTFLIPFFMGSFIAFVSFTGFHLIYLKILSLREGDSE